MTTNTANVSPPPRTHAAPVIQYIRRDFTYLDAGTVITVGSIPAGALILKSCSQVNIHTTFDGNSTNTIDIGASDDSGTNNFATAMVLTTIDSIPLDVTGSYYVTTDTKIVASIVSTASPTTGVAQIVIGFVMDNDL